LPYASRRKPVSLRLRLHRRIGLSYHSLGQYARALTAFTHAKSLGFQLVAVRYRLGRVYARLNDANHAFELLDSAFALAPGNFTPQQVDAEQDLVGLRSDARYAKLSSALAAARYPCRTQKEFQQFDFWIGQWDVTPWAGVTAPGQHGRRSPFSGRDRRTIVDRSRSNHAHASGGRKVRQVIEISRNGRTSWATTFDALYVPVISSKPN
jgi:tetratricopeptide (TPR) repeat protein